MFYLMPIQNEARVVKPSAISVLRQGIQQAKARRAPKAMIDRLEEELVAEGLISLFGLQKQASN